MRRFIIFCLLIAIVGGGSFLLYHKDRVHSVDDVWTLLSEVVELESIDSKSPKDQQRGELPVSRLSDSIRIASFNVQVLGRTKMSKPHVVDILARVMRKFDIVAIQEIRSMDQSVIPALVDKINSTGRNYDFVISERLGRTHSKEQYAYIFDCGSVEVDRNQLYVVNDPNDSLHREPFVGWFRVRGPEAHEAFTFSLVNIHTDPDEVRQEVNLLDDVVRLVRDDGRKEDDVILLGDLNTDDQRMGELASLASVHYVVTSTPTNTRGTHQYDNVIFQTQATTEFTGRGGVYDFLKEYNMTLQEALEISDHLPVWAEFSANEGGTSGQIAIR